ncbi:alpha/beta fold hydrolase [Humibacter sp.]|uniref:alpha/beta fold hydrolase n=1 Tax=Humibacter sp. TaxID=1940291 RepID=UPI003F80EA34
MTSSTAVPPGSPATAHHNGRSVPAEGRLVTADGVGFAVFEDGPRDGDPLLLIHGTAASSRSWEPLLPFATSAHRVIRIDLPGCGRSAMPETLDYGVATVGRQIGMVLDRLDVGPVTAVGHSSGGVFATGLAEECPGAVSALALIDTGPSMGSYIAEGVDLRGASWAELTDDQLRQAMRDGFHPGFAIPQDYVDQFRQLDFAVFGAVSIAIRRYLSDRALPDRLAPLGKPLLVIFGEQDARWNPASADDYRIVPDARIELLDGLGHSPNLEDPERVARTLFAV